MMEIVIKIPESKIPKQQDIIEIPLHFIDGKVCEAGGYEFDVLTKGHGDLKDVNDIWNNIPDVNVLTNHFTTYDIQHFIEDLPTIIEADGGGEDGNSD